jgi:hemoglobin
MTRSITARNRSIPGILVAILLLLLASTPAVAQSAPEDPSLYERLGGLPAIALVVSDFVDVFVQDPLIMANPAVRERKTTDTAPYIKYQVTTLVCQLSGGPCEYGGMSMADAHDGLNVSAEEWDRMVELFAQTLQRHQVPERETSELFALMGPARDDIVVGGP